jgi:hypothetical protein
MKASIKMFLVCGILFGSIERATSAEETIKQHVKASRLEASTQKRAHHGRWIWVRAHYVTKHGKTKLIVGKYVWREGRPERPEKRQ